MHRIEANDNFLLFPVAELQANHLLDELRIGAQALEENFLLLEARLGRRKPGLAGRLHLPELLIFRAGLEKHRASPYAEAGQEHDVEEKDEAARRHGAAFSNGRVAR